MKKNTASFAVIPLFLLTIWIVGNTSESPIEVTYLGNEGILITAGSNKVLIDALFDNPNPNYRSPSEDMLERMLSGTAPFDNVDLVLVTHNHPDHFSPGFAAQFMENNPNAQLMAAKDTVTAMKDNIKDWGQVQDRVFSFDLEPGETAEKTVGEIAVKMFRTLHSGDLESPHNLMYLIKMDGRSIFHEGDSAGKMETFEAFDFSKENIDLALVHFWFPLYPHGQKIILDVLRPEHVGLIHLPKRLESDAPSKIDMVKSNYKDIFLFVERGEKKIIR
ncbi:MAG: MBL fold metallo-hydrolase [Candidatus Aminicenantes bacterium]|nr:MAG: MBL fold metallo-hydrolase [Candidatus Aminicenantes bacterium]